MKENDGKLWRTILRVLRKIALVFGTILLIFTVCAFVFANILGNYLQNTILPAAQVNLENYNLDKTSYLYYFDGDGNVQTLQQVYTATDRRWVSIDEIPEDLIHAAIAIEDKRFYEHQGVDWITTVKASLNLFTGNRSTFGGSTLTQQLMKNLFVQSDATADDVTVQRKVIEIFRALAFEKAYDKQVVLEWYMNTIYFGEGCNGVKSAAENYFGKELSQLTTAECAALIGITNNPSLYNPYRTTLDNFRGEQLTGKERNRRRQEAVLEQMQVQGWITQEQYEQALAQELVFKRGATQEGDTRKVYSWYVDTVLEDVAKELALRDGVTEWNSSIRSNYMALISRGGYHIYTPFNAKAQLQVDKIYGNLNEIPAVKNVQQLQSAIVLVDNRSGDVVAMAGGVGKKVDFDAYNRADVPLQIGSSIKPLSVYAPAFDRGLITPATVIPDLPMTILSGGTPFPRNDNRRYHASRTVWRGVVSSINAVAVNSLEKLGTKYSFDFAKNSFGLSTLTDYYKTASGNILSDVDYSPLGMGALTQGATVRDVAVAYATFANGGVYRQGRTFLLVLDDAGNVVLDNRQQSKPILGKKAVNYMNYCLDSAVAMGTGTAADLDGMDVAGKTGTTASMKDRYFAGFTGYYTAAVWCGFDKPEAIVLSGSQANPAAVLWKKVMQPLHHGLKTIPLYSTKNMEKVSICLDSGLRATDSCYRDVRSTDGFGRVESVYVDKSDAPTAYCNKHTSVDFCTKGQGVANEYCLLFAEHEKNLVVQKALLKRTQEQINQLLAAEGKGLVAEFLKDNYVYLVNSKGNAVAYHGLHGNLYSGNKLPYAPCTYHTKAKWEEFLSQQQKPEEKPEPTTPTETTPSTEPSTKPTETTAPPTETTAPPTETTVPTEPAITAPSSSP